MPRPMVTGAEFSAWGKWPVLSQGIRGRAWVIVRDMGRSRKLGGGGGVEKRTARLETG